MKEEKTTIVGSGAEAGISTTTNYNGPGWKISTVFRENRFKSIARNGNFVEGVFYMRPFAGLTLVICETERTPHQRTTLKEQHAKALLIFDDHPTVFAANNSTPPEIHPGAMIFFLGHGLRKGSEGNNWIVYEIIPYIHGEKYLVVEENTLEIKTICRVKHFSKRNYSGYYFDETYYAGSRNDLNDLVIDANLKLKGL